MKWCRVKCSGCSVDSVVFFWGPVPPDCEFICMCGKTVLVRNYMRAVRKGEAMSEIDGEGEYTILLDCPEVKPDVVAG